MFWVLCESEKLRNLEKSDNFFWLCHFAYIHISASSLSIHLSQIISLVHQKLLEKYGRVRRFLKFWFGKPGRVRELLNFFSELIFMGRQCRQYSDLKYMFLFSFIWAVFQIYLLKLEHVILIFYVLFKILYMLYFYMLFRYFICCSKFCMLFRYFICCSKFYMLFRYFICCLKFCMLFKILYAVQNFYMLIRNVDLCT